jgi:hypothetical protein
VKVQMRRRTFIYLALTSVPAASAARAQPANPLRAVRYPCSLRRVCRELSRRYRLQVSTDPSLADVRVVWIFDTGTTLPTLLARLAELTSSRVTVRTAADGRSKYALERKGATGEREAAWRREGLLRTIRELLQAADQYERGTLRAEAFSPNVRTYLAMGRASAYQYLRQLSPQEMDRLLLGEEVRLRPGVVSEPEIQALIAARYAGADELDSAPDIKQSIIERELRATQEHGLGLQIDFGRKGAAFHLLLLFGPSGSGAADVLCRFHAGPLGLSLTRINPYLLLANPEEGGAATQVPTLQRRLEADIVLTGNGQWEAALAEFARATGVDLVSDAYLCRHTSRVELAPGQRLLLAPRGITIAEALDLVCRRFDYLWWEKDGCVYLRARSWMWDVLYETPDRFIDRWSAALHRRSIGAAEILDLAALSPLQLNGLTRLGGSLARGICGPDERGVRAFLQRFRSCSAAQQALILGAGLPVSPEQNAVFRTVLEHRHSETAARPSLLRLTWTISENSALIPPPTDVNFTLARSWGDQGSSSTLFFVQIPHFLNPVES